MKIPRIYPDTSIFGGYFDEEFRLRTRALFDMVGQGRAVLVISDILVTELAPSPPRVRSLLPGLPRQAVELVFADDESEHLRDAYLRAGAVGPRHHRDAHHIALATVARADLLVSWNFKHIVRYDRIRVFNAVNLKEGYPPIDIRSPLEVVP